MLAAGADLAVHSRDNATALNSPASWAIDTWLPMGGWGKQFMEYETCLAQAAATLMQSSCAIRARPRPSVVGYMGVN